MGALVWGYPGGMRGGYTKSVCQSLDAIVGMIEPCLDCDIDNWLDHHDATSQICGLGLSTYSKLLSRPSNEGGVARMHAEYRE